MLLQTLMVSVTLAGTTPPPPTYSNLLVPAEYSTIQEAIDAATLHDTVTIAPGTYRENLRLRGIDITVRGKPGLERPLIDAQHLGPGFYIETGESPATVIEHLSIANGEGALFGRPWLRFDHRGGGGVLIIEASPTIRDLQIRDCRAARGEGAGMAAYRSSSAIQSCEFNADSTEFAGGLLLWESTEVRIESCEFRACKAEAGGGAITLIGGADLSIVDCVFDSCAVVRSPLYPVWIGGAIAITEAQRTRIERCRFSNCQAPSGGAIGCDYSNDLLVMRSSFFRCAAIGDSDGIGNRIDGAGGAIYALATPGVSITGNTFERNLSPQDIHDNFKGGEAVYAYPAVFRNNIVARSYWTSEAVIGPEDRAYNLYWRNRGGDFIGEAQEGEIFDDPRFVEPGPPQDYRLSADSPAIDTGDPELPLDPDQTRSDMGAFPFHQQADWEETILPE